MWNDAELQTAIKREYFIFKYIKKKARVHTLILHIVGCVAISSFQQSPSQSF